MQAIDKAALIEQLDPKADYGERTYEQVRDGVINGDITILPGIARPVLKDPTNGLTIKGTGKPIPGAEANKRQRLQARLLDAADEDFDEVYRALMDAIRDGDVRAMKLWMESVIGRAPEMKPVTENSLMEKMFDFITKGGNTERRVTIDQ